MSDIPTELQNLKSAPESLAGHVLIAMPQLMDPFFTRSVVYICSHDQHGAMGLILNKFMPHMSFRDLFMQLKIDKAEESILNHPVHFGGPVETMRGYVLHSNDYRRPDTLALDPDIWLTNTVEIMRDIALNVGPQKTLVTLGHAGWGAGQLEKELAQNGWLHVKADLNLVFATKPEKQWETALGKLGITLDTFMTEAGQA